MTANPRPAVILMAEDDLADQKVTMRALNASKLRNELHIVQDGEEALDYLLRRGRYEAPESSPRPDLLLLDLNMPKVDGRQVLEEMKKHRDLRRIRVVVLTTSQQEKDIIESYDLGAHSYVTKPVKLHDFIDVVTKLSEYWFQIVVLPPRTE